MVYSRRDETVLHDGWKNEMSEKPQTTNLFNEICYQITSSVELWPGVITRYCGLLNAQETAKTFCQRQNFQPPIVQGM